MENNHVSNVGPNSRKTKRYNLRLHEKFIIICHPNQGSLNSRNELVSTCRHRKKHLLCSQLTIHNLIPHTILAHDVIRVYNIKFSEH